jgi:hypothetical protein
MTRRTAEPLTSSLLLSSTIACTSGVFTFQDWEKSKSHRLDENMGMELSLFSTD